MAETTQVPIVKEFTFPDGTHCEIHLDEDVLQPASQEEFFIEFDESCITSFDDDPSFNILCYYSTNRTVGRISGYLYPSESFNLQAFCANLWKALFEKKN